MSRSRLAAEYKHATGCTYKEAATLHGISPGPVAREYKILYAGLKRERSKEYAKQKPRYVPVVRAAPKTSRERIESALAFMERYDTTIRRAAHVCGVPDEELLAAYNERHGTRKQMVG